MIEPDSELDRLAYEVIGAAIAVHRELGPGFLESIYEEALTIELTERGIPFRQQVPITIPFHGRALKTKHRLDLLVADRLVVENKAVIELTPLFESITKSYLKATGNQLGLLINFNSRILKDGIRRIVYTRPDPS